MAVGEPSVEEPGGLADRLTAWQLRRWAEYAEIEPWGETRADLRAGIIASTLVNVNLRRGAQPVKPSDMMPDFEPRKPQTVAEMKSIFRHYAQRVKAADKAGSR